MIFVTVGSQLPFDRMVGAVDRWACSRENVELFAQIGVGATRPEHIEWAEMLDPAVFDTTLQRCSAVVSHAGCGTILSALVRGKPLLLVPRRGHLRETRNDHQLATARRFHEVHGVPFAEGETQIHAALDRLVAGISRAAALRDHASDELLSCLRTFLSS